MFAGGDCLHLSTVRPCANPRSGDIGQTVGVTPDEFDALSLPEQQVAARGTKDEKLQHHIIWRGDESCLPFLAANAENLCTGALKDILLIAIGRYLDGDKDPNIRGAYENLFRHAPRPEFDAMFWSLREDKRRQSYFDHLREQGVSIHPRVEVPDDWQPNI